MSTPDAAPEPMPRAVRRQAREAIVRQIVEGARRHLVVEGATGLSLRAVARDLGMVSSAVYRYVSSRDELLTLLIIDAYDALGRAVEDAEQAVRRDDLGGRWFAICHGVRDWARAHPHEYALVYGSPVPGYVAPQDTVGPATRVTALLSVLLQDAVRADPTLPDRLVPPAGESAPAASASAAAMIPSRPFVPADVPDELLLRGLMAWTYLFGAVSFELFGHHQHVIDDDPDLRRAFFTAETARIGAFTGLPVRAG
jgi:AcrR family transcriptional regulator